MIDEVTGMTSDSEVRFRWNPTTHECTYLRIAVYSDHEPKQP
jgi:hypothetical protein